MVNLWQTFTIHLILLRPVERHLTHQPMPHVAPTSTQQQPFVPKVGKGLTPLLRRQPFQHWNPAKPPTADGAKAQAARNRSELAQEI